jgi:hypothetical protein
MASFFGKYRSTVINNIDPMQLARLQVHVPDVVGIIPSSWAMPCLPIAGHQSGICAVPAIGSNVWIEFERGDANYPIWVGGFWSAEDLPPESASANPQFQKILFKTTLGLTLALTDGPGDTSGIDLSVPGGAFISIRGKTITITNGDGAHITLQGSTVTMGDHVENNHKTRATS